MLIPGTDNNDVREQTSLNIKRTFFQANAEYRSDGEKKETMMNVFSCLHLALIRAI